MSLDLQGKVALITGGSRGIGYSIAETFAASGSAVVLLSRGSEVEQQAQELAEKYSVKVTFVVGDIRDPQTAKIASKHAFSEYKRLDILVNNAGILKDGLIGMIPEDSIQDTLETNINGSLYMIQSCARLMARNDGGSIINLSSIIGRFGNRGQLVYSASKAAVIGATLSAAKELAPTSIRVNAIAPGYIDTDMIKDIDPEIDKERRESIAMGRIGTPQDVANLALFLASDLSAYLTGQVIGVDGGMLV